MDFSYSSLLVFALAVVPAIGWLTVYRYLDNEDPEPISAMVFAMFAGAVSTLPVFGVQALFKRFPDYDFLGYLYATFQNPIYFSVVFLLFVGFLEEFSKAGFFFMVVRKYERVFNQIVDGIIYGALVGLGFALAENIYYFNRALAAFDLSSNFLAVFSIRSFGTMLGHSLFAGVFGLYFAKAYFEPFLNQRQKKPKFWQNVRANISGAIRLHTTFLFLLPGKKTHNHTLTRNMIIMEGFLVAVLMHFMYNALIKLELFGKNWTFLIVPLIFVLAWYVWGRFFIKLYTRLINFVPVRKGVYRVKVK